MTGLLAWALGAVFVEQGLRNRCPFFFSTQGRRVLHLCRALVAVAGFVCLTAEAQGHRHVHHLLYGCAAKTMSTWQLSLAAAISTTAPLGVLWVRSEHKQHLRYIAVAATAGLVILAQAHCSLFTAEITAVEAPLQCIAQQDLDGLDGRLSVARSLSFSHVCDTALTHLSISRRLPQRPCIDPELTCACSGWCRRCAGCRSVRCSAPAPTPCCSPLPFTLTQPVAPLFGAGGVRVCYLPWGVQAALFTSGLISNRAKSFQLSS